MARVFVDGFESGSVDLWDVIGNYTIQAAGTGMDGAYQLYLGSSYAYLKKTLPAALSEVWVAFRFQPGGYTSFIFRFLNAAGTTLGGLTGKRDRLAACRGDSTVLAYTKTYINYRAVRIEIHYKPHATAGVFQVKIDGVLEIDFSGNTGSTENVAQIMLGNIGQWDCEGIWDNIVVDDAEYPGDTKIQVRMPNGAGNSTQWTPSTGANYACVDEKPPSDTDFNKTNVADNLDTFSVTGLTGSPDEVKAVAVQARCCREGTPTPTKLKMAVRTASTNYVSADIVPAIGSFTSKQKIWQNNPNTSSPWQPADALEIGYKAVA